MWGIQNVGDTKCGEYKERSIASKRLALLELL